MKTKQEIQHELDKVLCEMLTLEKVIEEARKVEQAAISHRVKLGIELSELGTKREVLVSLLEDMD